MCSWYPLFEEYYLLCHTCHVQNSEWSVVYYRIWNSSSHCTKRYLIVKMDLKWWKLGLVYRNCLSIITCTKIKLRNIWPVHCADKWKKVRLILFYATICYEKSENNLFPLNFVNILASLDLNLNLLLASTNQEIVRRLSIFLYKAFKVSDSVTS